MSFDIEKIRTEQLNGELEELFRQLETQPENPDLLARLCYELNIRSYHETTLEIGSQQLGRVDEAHEFWYEVVLATGLKTSILGEVAIRFKDRSSDGTAPMGFKRNMALVHLALGEDEKGRQLLEELREMSLGELDGRTYELFAQSEFADENYQQCIATCDRAIAASGPSARAVRLKGRCFLELDDLDRAAECFREALKIEPNFVRACHSMAVLSLESGFLDKALRYFGKATFINPEFSGNYFLLAEAFIDMRELNLAEAEFRKLLLLEPGLHIRAEVHNALGYILRKKGDFPAAKKELEHALDLEPQLAVAYYNLGAVFYRENDLDLAERHFKSALSIDPGHVASLVKLGLLNKGRKSIAEAKVFFEKALEVNPRQAQAYLGLSELARASNDTNVQLEHAKQAYRYGPENADICNNLGIAYECSGSLDQAEAGYLKALKIDPYHSQAANNLGYLFEKKMAEDHENQEYWRGKAIASWKIRYQICYQTSRSIKGATQHLSKLGLTEQEINAIKKMSYPPAE